MVSISCPASLPPPFGGRGESPGWPPAVPIQYFFFFFKITVFIMTTVTPQRTGGPDSVCFSNLFVNKRTLLHTWQTLLLWQNGRNGFPLGI